MTDALAVGVMSGTSLDGISTALVRWRDSAVELVAFRQEPYSSAERGAIIDAMARGTPKDLAFLHVALGERFSGARCRGGRVGCAARAARRRDAVRPRTACPLAAQHRRDRQRHLGAAPRRARRGVRVRYWPWCRSDRLGHAAYRSGGDV